MERKLLSYEDYLTGVNALSWEEMQKLRQEMAEEIGNDPDALELYDELMKAATRYAQIRAEWLLMRWEERADQDAYRTSCHDSVITHFNMLARYLNRTGKMAAWRDALGYEKDDRYNRKRIGDFACYLVFLNSLLAR